MQTFLPYSCFYKSAACLDKKRAWKQVVEAYQILNVLRGKSSGWKNHPVIKMWAGYELALTNYYNIFYHHCVDVHGIKTVKLKPEQEVIYANTPSWLGNLEFHASHRSNLLRKDFNYYSKFGWTEPTDLPYIWPVDIVPDINFKNWG